MFGTPVLGGLYSGITSRPDKPELIWLLRASHLLTIWDGLPVIIAWHL